MLAMSRRVTRLAGPLLGAAAVLSACSAGVADTPRPTEAPTPVPTPVPWELVIVDTSYSKEARVGDSIFVEVRIKNAGMAKNLATNLNFSELDQYADLLGCKPTCSVEDLPGLGPSAIFRGITPGRTLTARIEFVATTVGAVDWQVCLYDDDTYGTQVWCGNGTTAIR